MARASGGAAAREAIELTRFAGRSRASLTSVTITGVIAVAHTVPACQSLETTVAATTEEIAAATSVAEVETAARRRCDRLGSGAPAWRVGPPLRVGL